MKRAYAISLLLVLVWGTAPAQNVTKVGTTAAPFLNIGVGSRSVGMGGAYVSVAEDATAMFWNPAGISRMAGNQAVFSHAEWLADINFDYAGVAILLGDLGAFGANVTYLSMGDMERTTELEPEGTGELFGVGSYALGLTYARSLTDRFSIGFNLKYINEFIQNSSASGMAVDIGTMFTTPFNGMKIGMAISNFGTKMRMGGRDILVQHDIDPLREGNNENINAELKTGSYDLPLHFRVGVSMDLLRGSADNALLVALDAVHPNDNVESVNLGVEYVFANMVSLRGGYSSLFSEDTERGLTLGGGARVAMIRTVALSVDYAFEEFGRFNDIQKFSVAIQF